MKLDRKNIQKILFVGVVLIIVYLGLQHMNIIVEFLAWLLYVAMPFIVQPHQIALGSFPR